MPHILALTNRLAIKGLKRMEKTMQGRARAGWQDKETERLFQAVDQAAREGQPLRHVFESLSGELGRKPNSIRNYYYARLRQHPESSVQRAAPFQTFTQEEVRALLRQVLMARGQGKSVRSCVMDHGPGGPQPHAALSEQVPHGAAPLPQPGGGGFPGAAGGGPALPRAGGSPGGADPAR